MNLPHRTTFLLSYKFDYVGYSFSFNSRKCLISLLVSVLIHFSFITKLFSFCVFVSFLSFLLLIPSLSLWWSDRIQCVVSVFLYQLRLVPYSSLWSVLKIVPRGTEKNVYSFVFG